MIRSQEERANAHPVFAAYMEMRYSRNMARNEAREKVIPTYMGLIKQIDDQMGVLMQFLEARGLLDTTMIVFTSDHGDYLGDHWMGEKDLFHEQSAKIPLIVIDPSAAADSTRGTVSDALVEAIDLAPTFIDYFGSKPPDHILEGRSLLPLLHGDTPADWRKVVFSEYDYAMQDVRVMLNQPIERCRLFMVFDGRWKYIHASGFRPMLYDLESDPQEFVRSRRRPRLRRNRGAAAIGAVRLGAASEDAHHHAERKDRRLCRPAIAGQERRADRHLGRGGARRDQGEDRDQALEEPATRQAAPHSGDIVRLPPGRRRRPYRPAKRPIEGGLGIVAHRLCHARDRVASGSEQTGRELHAPARQILHRRLSDEMGETLRERRPRQPHRLRELIQCPIRRGIAMQEVQRLTDVSIAQAGKPAGLFGAKRFDMASDRLDKQQLAQPGKDALPAGPASFRFGPCGTDQESKPRIFAI